MALLPLGAQLGQLTIRAPRGGACGKEIIEPSGYDHFNFYTVQRLQHAIVAHADANLRLLLIQVSGGNFNIAVYHSASLRPGAAFGQPPCCGRTGAQLFVARISRR